LTPSITKQLRANGYGHNRVPNKDRADFPPVLESDHTITVVHVPRISPRIRWREPPALWARNPKPRTSGLPRVVRGYPAYIADDDLPGYAGASVMRAADDPVEQFSPQLGVRTAEIEGREKHCVKRKPTAEEGTQD
jgi:hypothetical protein